MPLDIAIAYAQDDVGDHCREEGKCEDSRAEAARARGMGSAAILYQAD